MMFGDQGVELGQSMSCPLDQLSVKGPLTHKLCIKLWGAYYKHEIN